MSATIVGATMAALFSIARIVEVALRADHPWSAGAHYFATLRVTPFYIDLNATGSYLALAAVPALWCATTRSWRWTTVTAPVIASALWLTGSRSALVAAAVGLAAVWMLGRRFSGRALAIGGLVILVLAPVVAWNPGRQQASAGEATEIRLEMARVGLRITGEAPWFGVGPGQFRQASVAFITPELIREFPVAAAGENAHNNYLQVLAELGLAGLAALLWILATMAADVWRQSRTGELTRAAAAFAGGVVAFLVSCLTGHPLLIGQVFYLFFLALGLFAGWATTLDGSATRTRVWQMLVVVLLISWPIRWAEQVHAAVNDRTEPIGASGEESGADGMIYRLADTTSAWFVPAQSTDVTIPMTLAPVSTDPCLIAITIDGRRADIVSASAQMWRSIVFPLPPVPATSHTHRIDLHVTTAGCQLEVGRLVTHP